MTTRTDDILISFDATSFFTNIAYEKVSRSFERRSHLIHHKCKILIDELINVTEFLFDDIYFVFGEKYYCQIEGCPMGSPVLASFANIVMKDLELACLDRLKKYFKCEPKYYYRYVGHPF